MHAACHNDFNHPSFEGCINARDVRQWCGARLAVRRAYADRQRGTVDRICLRGPAMRLRAAGV